VDEVVDVVFIIIARLLLAFSVFVKGQIFRGLFEWRENKIAPANS
jgi:hypothetical protein